MAKGNLFLGNGGGRVGNVVLATVNGEQITRVYQPNVKNPKSTPQMTQRAKFANSVKFYKRAVQNFFQFAYEDKKKNESYYNAFMRHNIERSYLLKKEQVDNPFFPALGDWMLTSGSIGQPVSVAFSGKTLSIAVGGTTVGAVSAALINKGFAAGDIVTIVTITSGVSNLNVDLATLNEQPAWKIYQFIIAPSDTTNLENIASRGVNSFSLAATTGAINLTHTAAAGWGAFIVTRKVNNKVYATNSFLLGDAAAQAMTTAAATENWIASVPPTWSASGEAILKGSIAIVPISGGGESGGGESGGGSPISGGGDGVEM